MPLKRVPPGASEKRKRAIISANIAEMIRAGHPRDQAVAAAERQARQDEQRRRR